MGKRGRKPEDRSPSRDHAADRALFEEALERLEDGDIDKHSDQGADMDSERQARFDHIQPHYLEALTLIERLHRRLLDVIKDEFDRRGRADINAVQALLLFNVGDKELTAGELRTRGYYLGSNVSYNLKKLVEMAFLDHQRSRVDRRSVRIKLTDKGREVRDIIESLYQKHVRTVEQVGGINAEEFSTLNKSLHRLERFWTDQILYRL